MQTLVGQQIDVSLSKNQYKKIKRIQFEKATYYIITMWHFRKGNDELCRQINDC